MNESEDITLSPGWIMMMFLSLMNELIDWIGVLLNVTGVWAIIIFILNLMTFALIMSWRVMTVSSPFLDYFGGWRGVLLLILEHIPIIGDIIPGWLLFMWGIRKKKIHKPTPKP